MDRNWNRQELAEHWSLRFEELARTEAKSEPLRLGFAAQLELAKLMVDLPHDTTRDLLALVKRMVSHQKAADAATASSTTKDEGR
jgi:hypothetical protein